MIWRRIITILTKYKANWSLNNIKVGRDAAGELRLLLPLNVWLFRVLDKDLRWIDEIDMLSE
ncbi:hypothetical protein [Clostridium sp.]